LLSLKLNRVMLSARSVFLLITTCVLCCTAIVAQPKPHTPQMPAPPPMKFISRDERMALNTSADPKTRERMEIDLAIAHLDRAEQLTADKKFDAAAEETGRYLALISDTLNFLGTMNSDKGKTRDLYRHFDISLRAHLPRLAVMRRSTPAEYAGNIKDAEEYVKNARSDALDSFYGHTVLRGDPENPKKTDKPKDAAAAQGGKHP
jgi:hypothetical protein